MSHRPIEVLAVEDSPADTALIQALFDDSALDPRITFLADGDEVLPYLRREGKYAAARCPDLILLDLNLPRKDGREVLKELKAHPDFRIIPVVVLTASDRKEDVAACYGLLANSFVTKPADLQDFDAAIRSIESYWFSLVRLPRRQPLASSA